MKILLDTDVGSDIDDALGLLLLLRLPDVELVGVTTVYGQVDIRAKVARKILNTAEVTVPVFVGSSRPMYSPRPIWHAGIEGHGVLSKEEFAAPLDAFDIQMGAHDFIVATIEAHRGEITVVALGALTNVAEAIRKRPEICQWVRDFYFMGGGVTYTDPVPDFFGDGAIYRAKPSHNIRCDIQAAKIVFESALPMRILTNDVTTALWWDGEPVRKLINATEPPTNAIVGKLLSIWLDYRTNIFGRKVTGTCPHDPLTVAEATAHSFVKYTPGQMHINSDGSTFFVPSANGRHLAGVDVQGDRFLEWFSRCVSCGP